MALQDPKELIETASKSIGKASLIEAKPSLLISDSFGRTKLVRSSFRAFAALNAISLMLGSFFAGGAMYIILFFFLRG